MNAETTTPGPRTGRALKLALAVSLALNLMVVGVLAGGAIRARMQPDPSPRAVVQAIWGALPDDTRADLRARFAEARAEAGGRDIARAEGARQRTAQAAALSDALRADPFDAAMLEALLRGDGGAREMRAAQMRMALVDALATLTPQERAEVAARLEAALARRGWR